MKECCKFHNRLDLKFPEDKEAYEEDSELKECGLAGASSFDQRYCCENCNMRVMVGLRTNKYPESLRKE